MSNLYSPEAVKPFQFDDSSAQERHETAMHEVAESTTFTSLEGQNFSGIWVNRDYSSMAHTVHIRPNSLFGDSKGADQKYIAYQHAAAFPENSFVVIDQPAHGASDVLTNEQSKQIKHEGFLGGVALSQIEGVRNLLPQVKNAVFTGEALGARMAAEMSLVAPDRNISPSHLFGFDMAGLENRSSAGLGMGFLASVLRSRKLYKEGKANESLVNSFEDFQKELAKYGDVHIPSARSESGIFRHERSLATYLLRNSPLANDNGARTLSRTLIRNTELHADLVFAGKSAVGRMNKATEAKLADIAIDHPHNFSFEIWPHDDQGIGYAAHSPRLVSYMKDRLQARSD